MSSGPCKLLIFEHSLDNGEPLTPLAHADDFYA
jgi:hypothetical protein